MGHKNVNHYYPFNSVSDQTNIIYHCIIKYCQHRLQNTPDKTTLIATTFALRNYNKNNGSSQPHPQKCNFLRSNTRRRVKMKQVLNLSAPSVKASLCSQFHFILKVLLLVQQQWTFFKWYIAFRWTSLLSWKGLDMEQTCQSTQMQPAGLDTWRGDQLTSVDTVDLVVMDCFMLELAPLAIMIKTSDNLTTNSTSLHQSQSGVTKAATWHFQAGGGPPVIQNRQGLTNQQQVSQSTAAPTNTTECKPQYPKQATQPT